jgi:type IX secretion system PorP/SprF family membrane protein
MKKIIIVIFALLTLSTVTEAQQMPLYSQYMMNGFLLNPAMAGSVEYTPIRLTARQQWSGITDAPATFALSGHTPLANNTMGVGGYIYSDHFGPISSTGIQGSYSYHLSISNETKLAFGLSFSAFQYKLDESALNLIDEGDNAITGAIETTFVPDANFGAYLYNEKYFVGFAAQQLIQFGIQLGDNVQNANQMVRHYYLTGGYTFDLGDNFQMQPSLLLKGTERSPFQLDFNLKAIYQKNYWLGVSYRTQDAIIAILGVKVDKYYLGYAFDYTMSNISNYTTGSHEILIGINIGEGANKGSSLL